MQFDGSWSPKNHQFAYWLTDKATKALALGLIVPGNPPTYFHLPNANRRSLLDALDQLNVNLPSVGALNTLIAPIWSPGGRYLITAYDLMPGSDTLVAQYQLNLIDTITKVVQPLSDRAQSPYAFVAFWSDNGQFLYYMQTNDKLQFVRADLMLFQVAGDRPVLLIPKLDLNTFDFVSQNIVLFNQPTNESDNLVALWKDSAKTQTFTGFDSSVSRISPVFESWSGLADNTWAIYADLQHTRWIFINLRTGVETHYDEPNFSDAITGFAFNNQWLSGLRLGPPAILKNINLTDGTEHDIPLPHETVGLLPDTIIWSSDNRHVAVVSRDQAYPDATFTVDVVNVVDGQVRHIRDVSPIYNSADPMLTSIAFGPCQ
jgi:hypothetical protein